MIRSDDFMIILGQYEEFSPGFGFPSIFKYLQQEPYEGKECILNYLNAGHVHMVTASEITDVITGQKVHWPQVYMDDGEYSWSSRLIYHVQKYNLRLPADVEVRILQKHRVIDEK